MAKADRRLGVQDLNLPGFDREAGPPVTTTMVVIVERVRLARIQRC